MTTEKRPLVTVVMPCRNDQGYAGRALRSLLDEWSIKACEFLVIDGGSTDRTREEVEEILKSPADPSTPALAKVGAKGDSLGDDVLWYSPARGSWVREAREEDRYAWNPPVGGRRRPVIRIIDNPSRSAARGLNIGILEARGAFIARVDARATYGQGYLRRCVELLEHKEAANAGGVEVPVAAKGPLAEAMMLALRHPLGGGSAKPRPSGFAASAESGTYRKTLFDEIGLFDPGSRADESSEMNVRIVLGGKKIWADGGLKVFRETPATFRELAGRYFRHGRGRARTVKKHRLFTSWRQIASPLLIAAMGYSLVRSFKAPSHLLFVAAYAAAVLGAAVFGPGLDDRGTPAFGTRLTAAAALATMHMSWGLGFLWGFAADW